MVEVKPCLCPYAVKELSHEDNCLIKKYYSKHQNEFVRFGEAGYVLPSLYQQYAGDVRNMPLRFTDIFVVAFPRSGTTWTQELVWLVANDLDFETAKSVPLGKRTPFLEKQSFQNESTKKYILESNDNNPALIQSFEQGGKTTIELLAEAPSPRNIRTHLPITLLPPGTLDTAKVVYVARDPRDVLVSCYHFYKSNITFELQCEFKEFFDMFITDLSPWAPYFAHVKEAWAQRNHPNMLFLFYEELSKDLTATARRVAQFLGKQYSDEQFTELSDFLSFANFQKSDAINPPFLKYMFKQDNFIRRGKAGGWRDYFDEDMETRADQWMAANMLDTDLRFIELPK